MEVGRGLSANGGTGAAGADAANDASFMGHGTAACAYVLCCLIVFGGESVEIAAAADENSKSNNGLAVPTFSERDTMRATEAGLRKWT